MAENVLAADGFGDGVGAPAAGGLGGVGVAGARGVFVAGGDVRRGACQFGRLCELGAAPALHTVFTAFDFCECMWGTGVEGGAARQPLMTQNVRCKKRERKGNAPTRRNGAGTRP